MGTSLISQAEWNEFYGAMGDAAETFANKPMTWCRVISRLNRWGEDEIPLIHNIFLKGLFNYNYMRTWPITIGTESGELDRQSMQILLHKEYLKTNGYINPFGAFEFSADRDRFVVDGIVYKCFGDTPVSQANTDDIWITIIVKREETPTGGVTQPILTPIDPPEDGDNEDEDMAKAVKNEIPYGLINSSNRTFSTLYPFVPSSLEITVNGLEQEPIVDFLTTGNNTFQLTEPPEPGDVVMIDYTKS